MPIKNGKRSHSTYGTSLLVTRNLSAAAICIFDIVTTKHTRSLYCSFRILRAFRSSSAEALSISASSPGTGGGDFGTGGRDKALMGIASGGTEASTKEGTDRFLLMDNVSTQKAPQIKRKNANAPHICTRYPAGTCPISQS